MENFKDNKYKRTYYRIIDNARSDNRISGSEYYENHHIIPKCAPFNGSNDKYNRILLTPKEHFICHLLLVEMCTGERKIKMAYALNNMTRNSKCNERKITSAQYSMAKRILSANKKGTKLSEEHRLKLCGRTPWNKGQTKFTNSTIMKQSLAISGENHSRPNLGKVYTIEERAAISKRSMGKNNPMYGKKHTEQFKEEQSERNKGRKHSEESKQIISMKLKGSKATTGYKWITNGIESILIHSTEELPENYKYGRITKRTKIK